MNFARFPRYASGDRDEPDMMPAATQAPAQPPEGAAEGDAGREMRQRRL